MDRDRRDDDDPTRALDGFLQRQQRAEAQAAAAPDLGDLLAKLHPERAANTRPKGGMLKDGTVWDSDDVVDVPVFERPRQPTPPPEWPELTLPVVDPLPDAGRPGPAPTIDLPPVDRPDPAIDNAVAQSTGQATAMAAAMWLAEARAARDPSLQDEWQSVGQPPPPDPRLLSAWRSGAWIAARRLAVPAATEIVNTPQGPLIETYPPQHLVVLWSPVRSDTPHLGRWPRQAFLSAAPAERLDAVALAQVPGDTPLWWLPATSELADWALAAEIVLIHENTLRPFQVQALKTLIEQEREAAFSRVNNAYHRPASGEPVQRKP